MTQLAFELTTHEEVVRFEKLLDDYTEKRAQMSLNHFSLASAFTSLKKRADGGKIFAALLDIRVNFVLLFLDSHDAGAAWNQSFSIGKLEGGSVLDAPEKFFGKMDIHRFNSSLVFRYRAFWDKIMGLLIMIYSPSEYEGFAGAKSRKRAFRKICLSRGIADEKYIEGLEKLLTDFDNQFRTGEAHGTGILRKHSFTMHSLGENPNIRLIAYENALHKFMLELGKTLDNRMYVPEEQATSKNV